MVLDPDVRDAAKAIAQEVDQKSTKLVVAITQEEHERALMLAHMMTRLIKGVMDVLTTPNVAPRE